MKRSELYRLVWSEPMRTLAPKFGLSDRGLAKLCERHDIPVPQRGYWNRVQAGGGSLPATPLPNPHEDVEVESLSMRDHQGWFRSLVASSAEVMRTPETERIDQQAFKPVDGNGLVLDGECRADNSTEQDFPTLPKTDSEHAFSMPSASAGDTASQRSELDQDFNSVCAAILLDGLAQQRTLAERAYLLELEHGVDALSCEAARIVLAWIEEHRSASDKPSISALARISKFPRA